MENNVVTLDTNARLAGRANMERFHAFAARYREDPELRARIESGDLSDAVAGLGLPHPPEGKEVRIVADTLEVVHIIMPPDPNADLTDESLRAVAGGGKCAGTTGCAGTASTMACSTIPGSVSTASTAGTVGKRVVTLTAAIKLCAIWPQEHPNGERQGGETDGANPRAVSDGCVSDG